MLSLILGQVTPEPDNTLLLTFFGLQISYTHRSASLFILMNGGNAIQKQCATSRIGLLSPIMFLILRLLYGLPSNVHQTQYFKTNAFNATFSELLSV